MESGVFRNITNFGIWCPPAILLPYIHRDFDLMSDPCGSYRKGQNKQKNYLENFFFLKLRLETRAVFNFEYLLNDPPYMESIFK